MKRNFCVGILVSFILLASQMASAQCELCYQGGCYTARDGGFSPCLPNTNGTCTLGPACGIGGCFVAGTVVETQDGPVPIEAIEIGDEVLSLDDEGQRVFATVTRTYRTLGDEYLLINGSMRVTPTHPFWVDGVWVIAGDLKAGNELAGVDGSPMLVDSIESVKFGVRVYNIEVEGTHTFFVDGVLVHNKDPDPEG